MPQWATNYIKQLQEGKLVQFRPRGNSMQPYIYSGQLVTVAPVDPDELCEKDIVLCKVHSHHYLHLVQAISKLKRGRFKIGNAHGHTNGWIGPAGIYGKVMRVGP